MWLRAAGLICGSEHDAAVSGLTPAAVPCCSSALGLDSAGSCARLRRVARSVTVWLIASAAWKRSTGCSPGPGTQNAIAIVPLLPGPPRGVGSQHRSAAPLLLRLPHTTPASNTQRSQPTPRSSGSSGQPPPTEHKRPDAAAAAGSCMLC